MDQTHISFIVNVLSHVEEFKVDWQAVATENGISRKDNCTTKFKGIMKKYGLDFANNKFTAIEGFEHTMPPAVATPKTPKTPKVKTPQKRKAIEGDGGGCVVGEKMPDSPSPKKQKSKAKAKKETVTDQAVQEGPPRSGDEDEEAA